MISMSQSPAIHHVQVIRDGLGPFDGAVIGEALAYTFVWNDPNSQPPCTWHERTFVLLEAGIQLSNPMFQAMAPGTPWLSAQASPEHEYWYVDLIAIKAEGDLVTIRDLDIDAVISTNGRGYRLLDLEEFGEAIEAGEISLIDAIDGLKRWQGFLDRHLHSGVRPKGVFPDFPPASIQPLVALVSFARSENEGDPSGDRPCIEPGGAVLRLADTP
jgi:hypothetical protein